jgi:hypothetical protein
VGERPERDRIRAEIHLTLAIAYRKRRTVARADHQVAFAGEDEAQRERAAQLRQRTAHRIHRPHALRQQAVNLMQHGLGIGLGLENSAPFLELLAQLAAILDDAVVNHGYALGRVRMRIVFGWLAVGRPARMPDARMA